MKWIYLYQGMNDLCKYVSSEKPDEWQSMMYDDFITFLSKLNITDRPNFMFYFSFVGKILFIDLTTGDWEEEVLDNGATFESLLSLNQKEEEEFTVKDFLKGSLQKSMEYINDKVNHFKFQ